MKKAIVAISGGIDSAVVSAIAKSEGYELYFLTVNYGQKNIFSIHNFNNCWNTFIPKGKNK